MNSELLWKGLEKMGLKLFVTKPVHLWQLYLRVNEQAKFHLFSAHLVVARVFAALVGGWSASNGWCMVNCQ